MISDHKDECFHKFHTLMTPYFNAAQYYCIDIEEQTVYAVYHTLDLSGLEQNQQITDIGNY